MAKYPILIYGDEAGFAEHEAHADLHITEEAFDQVVWHLQATLQELEIQQEDQQAILAVVQARRDEVVTFEESISPPVRSRCTSLTRGASGTLMWTAGRVFPGSWLTRPPVTAGSRSAFPCLYRSGRASEPMARDRDRSQ
jgi:Bacterial-like globin